MDDIRETPEGKLVSDIFGIRRTIHPYLYCSFCGKEYFGTRPTFCGGCGYAGGAIKNPTLPELKEKMQKQLGKRYERSVKGWCQKIVDCNGDTGHIKSFIAKNTDKFMRDPGQLALALCAVHELKEYFMEDK